ncbi:MAG: hypothetical protein UT24_C0011G0018 [Candidatus Woesebacteria bacterium GW2011_GWB1_39_12]|uniref:Uncharacterized protein n=1 Tax=Candidatus Woesebacteria bacterium GW2011_GWB1_39_12 TaxID=1618574 RepID=A0A0G0PQY4_9BACT|nr:MAG: hypothetical protein UT24_C0011G0018 [Candidatus Woesebacteria bacterium GW2011_GWB1_39_12]
MTTRDLLINVKHQGINHPARNIWILGDDTFFSLYDQIVTRLGTWHTLTFFHKKDRIEVSKGPVHFDMWLKEHQDEDILVFGDNFNLKCFVPKELLRFALLLGSAQTFSISIKSSEQYLRIRRKIYNITTINPQELLDAFRPDNKVKEWLC